jgi:HD-like signal output (HDOD) protein
VPLTVKDYLDRVDRVRDLPTLPTIFTELTQMLSDSNSNIHQVERLMGSDQSLTMRVLKVANSAYYRVSDRVTTIGEAVNYLGFDRLKKVALSSSILSIFKGPSSDAFNVESFWKHGIGVAVASGAIAKYVGLKDHETTYVCGLVHDIGKIVNYMLDAENFLKIVQFSLDEKVDLCTAERTHDYPRHDVMGYYVCKHWKLSKYILAAVGHHHEDNVETRGVGSESLNQTIDIVSLANKVAHQHKFGFSGHEVSSPPTDELVQRIGIPPVDLPRVIEIIEQEWKSVAGIFKVLGA